MGPTTVFTKEDEKDIIDLFAVLVRVPKDTRGYMKGYAQAVLDYDMYKQKEGA